MTEKFNFEEALKAIQSGQAISGKDGVLAPLVKQLTEAAPEGELESHLAEDVWPNRRNEKSKKTLKTRDGTIELDTTQDRSGTFEPQIIKKHQTSVSDEIESKILSMHGRGMSYSDISEHVQEMYGISVSTVAISTITDKIIESVQSWQQRALGIPLSVCMAGCHSLQGEGWGSVSEQGGVYGFGPVSVWNRRGELVVVCSDGSSKPGGEKIFWLRQWMD